MFVCQTKKETWKFITWIMFVIYLHIRTTPNIEGVNSAIEICYYELIKKKRRFQLISLRPKKKKKKVKNVLEVSQTHLIYIYTSYKWVIGQ